MTFTLPQVNYRFRGDLNGTQFRSGLENHCTMPGCSSASIVLPGGNTSRNSVTINYTYDGLSRLSASAGCCHVVFHHAEYRNYHFRTLTTGDRVMVGLSAELLN